MCKHGTNTSVLVKVAADLSSTGEEKWREFGIDFCIAPIVKALQEGGIDMRASCCGHGNGPGRIELVDGRALEILSPETPTPAPPLVLNDDQFAFAAAFMEYEEVFTRNPDGGEEYGKARKAMFDIVTRLSRQSAPSAPTGEPEPPQYVLDALKSIGIECNTEYPDESDWITHTEPHGAQPASSLTAALAKMQRAAENDGRRAASSQEEPHMDARVLPKHIRAIFLRELHRGIEADAAAFAPGMMHHNGPRRFSVTLDVAHAKALRDCLSGTPQ